MNGPIDVQACVTADEAFHANHPELRGRQLTMAPADGHMRKEWMALYRSAKEAKPKPPPPLALPLQTAQPPPPPAGSTFACPIVAAMTHEQKMEAAIKGAGLAPAVMQELGDIKTLVASMVIVGGTLALLAATGYGAVAEAVGAGLLVVGAAMSGAQIGGGLVDLAAFANATRCDTAKNLDDLKNAGKLFASSVAKTGVGGLNLLLAMAGGRGRSLTGGASSLDSTGGGVENSRAILEPLVREGRWQELVDSLDVGTEGKQGFLWSGNKQLAAEEASKRGGIIMEQTKGGKIIDDWEALKDVPWETQRDKIWGPVSAKYADGLRGSPDAFVTSEKPNGGFIFQNFEMPAIEVNHENGAAVDLPKLILVRKP